MLLFGVCECVSYPALLTISRALRVHSGIFFLPSHFILFPPKTTNKNKMVSDLSLYSVKAFLILDNEGKRVFAKYYSAPHDPLAIPSIGKLSAAESSSNSSSKSNKNGSLRSTRSATEEKSQPLPQHHQTSTDLAAIVKEQKAFEKGLFKKTNKQNSDIILHEDIAVVAYKQVSDVIFYVVGSTIDENELMLFQALAGVHDSLSHLLRNTIDKRTLLENYDLLSLVVDEAIDSGIILEVNPNVLESRVSRAPANEPSINNIELSEQGLLNMYQFARGKFSEKLRQQFQG